jgi:hypothetical protein
MQVYTVWGLGFGDDEAVWELCSIHRTQKGADDAKQAILDECEGAEVDVRPEPLLD